MNYVIKDTTIEVEGIENVNERKLQELIGKSKQAEIFHIIERKEKLFSDFATPEVIQNLIEHSYNNYLSTSFRQKWIKNYSDDNQALNAYKEELFKKLNIENPFEINDKLYNIWSNDYADSNMTLNDLIDRYTDSKYIKLIDGLKVETKLELEFIAGDHGIIYSNMTDIDECIWRYCTLGDIIKKTAKNPFLKEKQQNPPQNRNTFDPKRSVIFISV